MCTCLRCTNLSVLPGFVSVLFKPSCKTKDERNREYEAEAEKGVEMDIGENGEIVFSEKVAVE